MRTHGLPSRQHANRSLLHRLQGWVLFGMLLQTSSLVLAHDGDEPSKSARKVLPAEAYAPTPLPDRIILTWSDSPTTTQSVTWRTSVEVASAKAELAVATAGPEMRAAATSFVAESVALKTDLNTAHFHSVTFKGLSPGTKYAYRVGDGNNWSEWFHFSTANTAPEPFSFIYFGDAQNDVRSLWSRVVREAYSDAPNARFMLHAGDLINRAEADGEWGEWFSAGGWLNAMIPNIPVVGNHEIHKVDDQRKRLSHHWRPQFTLPEHGPEGLEETCYTFAYQNTRFVILNSNTKLQEQAQWLEKTLRENTLPWVVCSFHHPIFSTAKDRDNAVLRATWKPILDRYRVDLVLQGHDHSYGRTGLDTPTEPSATVANVPVGVTYHDTFHGIVYVVSVSGPKMYNVEPKPFMQRVAEDTQLYQLIHIDGTTLRYEARTATGDLYDAFTLHKDPMGGPNTMVEVAPSMGERRRTSQPAPAPSGSIPSTPQPNVTQPNGAQPAQPIPQPAADGK